MNNLLPPKTGSWLFIVGPRDMNTLMLNTIARLAILDEVRVLDAGNRFNVYTVAREARGHLEISDRIMIARAFTCYQVLSGHSDSPDRAGHAQHLL
jgi:hypothetical protein